MSPPPGTIITLTHGRLIQALQEAYIEGALHGPLLTLTERDFQEYAASVMYRLLKEQAAEAGDWQAVAIVEALRPEPVDVDVEMFDAHRVTIRAERRMDNFRDEVSILTLESGDLGFMEGAMRLLWSKEPRFGTLTFGMRNIRYARTSGSHSLRLEAW